MPKLSIITICFNDREGLEKTMSGVLAQSFTDYEYIVIDGGSADGSADVIKKYASRLAYSVSEKDNGIYDAQNKGWKKASGEYCLFLNAGDYLVNENTLAEIFSVPFTEDLVYGDLIVDNGKDALYRLAQPFPFTVEDLVRTTLFHPATLIRRTLLEEAGGYDVSFRIVGDYDFFFKVIVTKQCSTKYIAVPFTVFNTGGIGSDPANKKEHDAERKKVQLKYLTEAELEGAAEAARKKLPRSERLKASTANVPVVRELANFGLLVYNRIRKAGR